MASGLAIDFSDIDLGVVGLDFGDYDRHLCGMKQLVEKLEMITSISSIKLISSATVPVIKLSVDL